MLSENFGLFPGPFQDPNAVLAASSVHQQRATAHSTEITMRKFLAFLAAILEAAGKNDPMLLQQQQEIRFTYRAPV